MNWEKIIKNSMIATVLCIVCVSHEINADNTPGKNNTTSRREKKHAARCQCCHKKNMLKQAEPQNQSAAPKIRPLSCRRSYAKRVSAAALYDHGPMYGSTVLR
jgi:cytochrome c553